MRAFVCFAILVFVQVAEAQTDSGKRLRPETRYCWVLEKPGRNQDKRRPNASKGKRCLLTSFQTTTRSP